MPATVEAMLHAKTGGTEDSLLDENRWAHERLTKLRVPHEHEKFPGVHDWGYRDLHVREAIAFHGRALRIKKR